MSAGLRHMAYGWNPGSHTATVCVNKTSSCDRNAFTNMFMYSLCSCTADGGASDGAVH